MVVLAATKAGRGGLGTRLVYNNLSMISCGFQCVLLLLHKDNDI